MGRVLERAALAAGTALLAALAAAAPAPSVTRVEPPSWWAGHSLNPVRLLVYGADLQGARVEAVGAGLSIENVAASASGRHLFADVAIDPKALPGPRRIRITTAAGAAEAPFELLAPLPREGRFQGFSQDDAIYLLMPDRFANGDPGNDDPPRSRGLLDRGKPRHYHGGDLRGVIERLPYLADLGVTALWMTPVYDNNDRPNDRERYDGAAITDYHGYGAVDFYAVDEHLGELATLRELVDKAHQLGLKVIQDQVANHTGPYHPWVKDPPTPTWFNGTEAKHLKNVWQTWTLADPHATPELQRETLDGWFIDILPDLDQDDPEVARYLIQNTLWWVGITGLDGIRQDTLPYVPRRFWRDWMAAIKREHPDLRVVGEMSNGDPALVSFFQGGAARFDGIDTGIDTLFDFPLFHALRRAFAERKPLGEVALLLAHDYLYPDPAPLVTFLGSHDETRFMNVPGAEIAGLKQAFSFLLTTRGTPLVYYGDEIAMPGGGDPDNRRDFPGGWRDDPRSAFGAEGRSPEQQEVFEHVRRLLRLRAAHPALRRGSLLQILATDRAYAFARRTEAETLLVVIADAPRESSVELEVTSLGLATGTSLQDLMGQAPATAVSGGRVRLTLPPRSTAVFLVGADGR